MLFSIIVLVLLTIVTFFFLKMNHKLFFIVMSLLTLITTVIICVQAPKMHNRFSMDVVDYLIKFNSDGSVTTTKQVTTEVLQEERK